MAKNPQEIKIFVTRDIPSVGIELLKKEGFAVFVWPHDRPVKPGELIEEGKKVYVYFNNTAGDAFQNLMTLNKHLNQGSNF